MLGGISTNSLSRGLDGPQNEGTGRESAIHREIQELFRELNKLESVTSGLVERISPVLRPDQPSTSSNNEKMPEPPVALVADLARANARIHAIIDFIGRVISRVEL